MKIVAIVQARTKSTRLPGKVLKEIVGKPLVWHVINRLTFSKRINEIIMAIPDGDEPLIEFAREYGIKYYAGSENDLLDRFYQASMQSKADASVRVTADCPLIDPEVIDRLIKYFLDEGPFDFVNNSHPRATFPHGLDAEVWSFQILERLWRTQTDPLKREWLSLELLMNPGKYQTGNLENEEDLSSYRWTVDYEEDFKFVTEVFQRLYKEGSIFFMRDIIHMLRKHPELVEINKKYERDEALKQTLAERGIDAKSIYHG